MADYNAIVQMLHRYCFAHDSRDVEGVKACFAKDITNDGLSPSYKGLRGRDAFVEKYAEGYRQLNSKQGETVSGPADAWRKHVLTNIYIVEDRGDEADVRSYVTLYLIKDNDLKLQLTGTYLDTVIIEDGDWKIKHRKARMDVGPYRVQRD